MPINGKKILYHGTSEYHKKILLDQGRPFVDFGCGYYLTSDRRQASTWALRGSVDEAWVFEYSISEKINKEILQLQLLECNMDWLDVVLYYRIGLPIPDKAGWEDIDRYDIIYDRMADGNKISTLISQYKNACITKDKLLKQIQGTQNWNMSKDQYCFRSEKALHLLQRTKEYYFHDGNWEVDTVNE